MRVVPRPVASVYSTPTCSLSRSHGAEYKIHKSIFLQEIFPFKPPWPDLSARPFSPSQNYTPHNRTLTRDDPHLPSRRRPLHPTRNPKNLLPAAIDPDSISTFTIAVDGDVIWGAWEAIPGSAELQEIPGLAGLEGSDLDILGVMGAGEYLGILEVRTLPV